MKKLVTCSLCLFLLAGCAGTTHQETASPTSSAATSASSSTVTADPAKKMTITNSLAVNAKTLDMSGYEWLKDPNPAFIQISMSDSLKLMDEGGNRNPVL